MGVSIDTCNVCIIYLLILIIQWFEEDNLHSDVIFFTTSCCILTMVFRTKRFHVSLPGYVFRVSDLYHHPPLPCSTTPDLQPLWELSSYSLSRLQRNGKLSVNLCKVWVCFC